MSELKQQITKYIVDNFYNEEESGALADDTLLISTGVIDSMAALQLVEFLEKSFSIEFKAHEVNQDNLDSINTIAAFVQQKINA